MSRPSAGPRPVVADRRDGRPPASLEQLSIDTIRTLAIDAVQAANSGHPGAPMGAAPMAYVLWTRFLKHAPLREHLGFSAPRVAAVGRSVVRDGFRGRVAVRRQD